MGRSRCRSSARPAHPAPLEERSVTDTYPTPAEPPTPAASPQLIRVRLLAMRLLDRLRALRSLAGGPSRPCDACGHPRSQHDHLRAGTDCSAPDCPCPRYL